MRAQDTRKQAEQLTTVSRLPDNARRLIAPIDRLGVVAKAAGERRESLRAALGVQS